LRPGAAAGWHTTAKFIPRGGTRRAATGFGALLTSLQRRLKSCRVLAPWRETSRSRTNALRSVRAWGAEILDAYARRFCWQRLKRGTAACRDTDFFQARVHVADPYPSRPRRAHAEM